VLAGLGSTENTECPEYEKIISFLALSWSVFLFAASIDP
jgi:hypothetical protein